MFGGAPSASAACNNPGFFFDGFLSQNDPVGAKGFITDRNINVCGPSAAGSASAWIMLAGGGSAQFAQIGFVRSGNSPTESLFTEYEKNASTNAVFKSIPGFNYGTAHGYEVHYSFSANQINMIKGGNVMDSTNFNPKAAWGSPWTGQFNGETHDRQDDIPGTPANKTDFSGLATQNCQSCGYTDPSNVCQCRDANTPDAYKFEWVNRPSHMAIWTNR